MKRFIQGMCVVAAGVVGIGAMTGALLLSLAPWNTPAERIVVQDRQNQMAQLSGDCIPKSDSSVLPVGGLSVVDVPRIPGMLRLDYDESVYAVRQKEEPVMHYYLSKLASQCWTLRALGKGEAQWEKNGIVLALAVEEEGLGQKSVLTYGVGGEQVRGVKLAQTDSTTCPSGQQHCPGTGCVAPGTPCTTSGSGSGSGTYTSGCSSDQYYCQGACVPMGTSCPSSSSGSGSGSSGSSGSSCGPAPTGCTNGYTYTNGCATSCAPAQTSCTSEYAQTGSYSCNYSKCPSGCNYGSDGCPNGCYTSPSCSGEYQTPGSTSPSCNYTKCPNGCNWANGCPTGCSTQSGGGSGSVSCSGEYQPSGISSPSCNYSKCPNGCTYGAGGCPTGCISTQAQPASCSGEYQSPGATTPLCNASKCPNGCNWTNGCPTGCYSSTGTGTGTTGTGTCSGQYQRRGATGPACDANKCAYGCTFGLDGCPTGCLGMKDKECPNGQVWCSSTQTCKLTTEPCVAKSSCDVGFIECSGACIAEGTICYATKTACPTGQYLCNSSCIPTTSSCNGYPYYEPGKQQCGSGMYFCGVTNSCVSNSSSCSSTQPTQPTQPQPQIPPSGPDGDYRQGPSDEDLKRMNEERLKHMKRDLEQFTRGIKQMERMVKRMESRLLRAGVGIPPELKAAIAKAPEVLAKIKDAKTAEEVEDLMDDIQDIGDSMQEWGPKFGDLTRLAEMLGRADRDLKTMDRAVKRLVSAAKKNQLIADMVTEVQTSFDGIKTAIQQARTLAKEDPEAALDMVEDDFYGKMEEFWNGISEVDSIANMSKGIRQARQEIARAERRISSLQRSKKVDSSAIANLRELVEIVKQEVKTFEAVSKNKPVDIDELREAARSLWESIAEFENSMAEVGAGFYRPDIRGGENVAFELPDAFNFREGPTVSSEEGFPTPVPSTGTPTSASATTSPSR